ncbi:MAG: hypothetical protein R3227_15875 [Reinekea sp.]|nr:hypothetical protein [Reinekea sp.]
MITQQSRLIQRDQHMLIQFTENLQTTINRLMSRNTERAEPLEKLKNQLSGKMSWQDVNSVEVATVDFLDEPALMAEWQRRLAEVEFLPAHLQQFYKSKIDETDTQVIRSYLIQLITDIQWRRESKRIMRAHQGQMRTKVVALFLLSFVLFFTPTLCRAVFGFEFTNLRLYYLFTAATAGILGSSFSQLTSLQSKFAHATLDQMQAINKVGYILARATVGAGAGLTMFYLLQSGLLSGAFFPEFIQDSAELAAIVNAASTPSSTLAVSQAIEFSYEIGTLAHPPQGLSLLIVWCILAGFSEKLIPGILNNKAKKLEESSLE